LATAGVVSLVVPIATGAIDAAALSEGQAPNVRPPRVRGRVDQAKAGGQGQAGPIPGGYRAVSAPIFLVIGEAYSTRFSDQIDLIARYEGTPIAAQRQAMWRSRSSSG
jgi:hypothetical protein